MNTDSIPSLLQSLSQSASRVSSEGARFISAFRSPDADPAEPLVSLMLATIEHRAAAITLDRIQSVEREVINIIA